MIRMKGIRKEYRMGDSVLAALDGVDIHIKPHEFVSIIGLVAPRDQGQVRRIS